MSKAKDAQAAPAILEYLNKQNRPYSAVDILNNLHKEYGKTAVTKALDALAAEGKIHSKTYNKQTVYVADQSRFPDVDDSELKSMEVQIGSLTQQLKACSDSQRQMESDFQSLNSAITTEEAQLQLAALTKECDQLVDKLKTLKSNPVAVSPVERQEGEEYLRCPSDRQSMDGAAILKARTLYVKEWRKRKRMVNEFCMDMVDAILEGYPKSKKDLFEEVGIEADEAAGVKIPDA